MKIILHKLVITLLILFTHYNISAQLFLDFDDASKTKYASAIIQFAGHDWELDEAIIEVGDNRRLRLKGNTGSSFTQMTDKEDGIGSISFDYTPYGSDSQSKWFVEYTKDDGVTWTQIGEKLNNVESGPTEVFNEEVKATGNIRFRIFTTDTYAASANRRLDIDNILITNWIPTITNFNIVNGDEFAPGDKINFSWQAEDVDEIIIQAQIEAR